LRGEKGVRILNEITKRLISEATTEQLDKSFEGIVEAMSYRSAQGMGTDRTLSGMAAMIAAEINAREIRP
jgi:molybdopterin biosynthesis enzyme MoaB